MESKVIQFGFFGTVRILALCVFWHCAYFGTVRGTEKNSFRKNSFKLLFVGFQLRKKRFSSLKGDFLFFLIVLTKIFHDCPRENSKDYAFLSL